MPAQALPFPDVLEEEYRYFFDDDPYGVVEFDRKHVREIADLAQFLKTIRTQKPSDPLSRWQRLAARCFNRDGTLKRYGPREYAVIAALNGMLRDPALLRKFLKDDHFKRELRESAALRHTLLRIPVARRLLLARPEFAAEMSEKWVVESFRSRSQAILRLAGDGKGGFSTVLRLYPALLSTIADDDGLSGALMKRAQLRKRLKEIFEQSLTEKIVNAVAARLPHPVGMWLAKKLGKATEERRELSADPVKLRARIGLAFPARANEQRIPDKHLTRFNAVLIETAYSHYVSNGHQARALYAAIHQKETAALCLSGGGIRSATFNLGVLQGLADHRMLNRFHYLSTVSGGGYIGSWLSSWMRRHREGAVGVAKDLGRKPGDPLQPEVKPIAHLREYSSYLAPRTSAFSLDSWTLVATYIRNLLLNWTMLLPFLVAVLTLPRLLQSHIQESFRTTASPILASTAVVLAFLTAAISGGMRPTCKPSDGTTKTPASVWWWLVPLLGSAVTFNIYWASKGNEFLDRLAVVVPFALAAGLGSVVHASKRLWIDGAAGMAQKKGIFLKAWGFVTAAIRFRRVLLDAQREVLCAVIAGIVSGLLLHGAFFYAFPPHWLDSGIAAEVYVCLGIPLFLMVYFVHTTLLVGFSTVFSEDFEREWWARSAAALFVYGVMHVVLASAVLLLPALLFQAPTLTAPFGGIAGIGSYLLSRSLKNRKEEDGGARRLMPLLRVAATVTMMFVVAGISILTTTTLQFVSPRLAELARQVPQPDLLLVPARAPWLVFGEYSAEATVAHFQALRQTPTLTLYLLIGLATVIAAVMSRLLNVNVYSMHGMYRNRLMRAYLGASRWGRRPDPFTGFDPRDNLHMWELRPEMLWPSCIVDFDAFALRLKGEKKIWRRLPVEARNHLLTFQAAMTPEEQRATRDVARTVIVDALNHLMMSADLKLSLPAPPSPQLLARNRKYLDKTFGELLKQFPHTVLLNKYKYGTERVESPGTPEHFRDGDTKPVRGRPPLHVVNAALNLVGGDNLAWQERKAASFTVSTLHAGGRLLGYRDTTEYCGSGITLGTALAISGAAVSPNSGASSSPTFTFLMTMLNARLGWWLGNPQRTRYGKNSPRGSITALLREALGRTDSDQDFVFLSDGGHFENLGLYEMVLRRCKYIVVCDATADDRYAFGDLANAVRKIRIDLGIPIEPLLTKYIGPQKDEKYGKYCAIGEIRYGSVDAGAANGYLLYIKPAVYSDCPADVRNYGNDSKTFPHENTVDQFFSESQFESYRALGRHIIGRISHDTPGSAGPTIFPNVRSFFASAWDYVNEQQPPVGDAPVGTMHDVVNWMASSLGTKPVIPVLRRPAD